MKTLLSILRVAPYVFQYAAVIEQEVGSAMPGSAKKQLIMQGVQIAAQLGESMDNKTVQVISTVIDSVVAQLNQSAVLGFGKDQPQQQPAVQEPPQSTPSQGNTKYAAMNSAHPPVVR